MLHILYLDIHQTEPKDTKEGVSYEFFLISIRSQCKANMPLPKYAREIILLEM